jgi:hypothetical protein
MPDNGPPSYKKLAYSLAHENTFFVVLDTFGFKPDGANWDNGLDAEQLAWFSGQARGAAQKFKFAFSHGPAFSPEGFAVDDSVKKTMWGIMEGAKFDAYFCGHEHNLFPLGDQPNSGPLDHPPHYPGHRRGRGGLAGSNL